MIIICFALLLNRGIHTELLAAWREITRRYISNEMSKNAATYYYYATRMLDIEMRFRHLSFPPILNRYALDAAYSARMPLRARQIFAIFTARCLRNAISAGDFLLMNIHEIMAIIS